MSNANTTTADPSHADCRRYYRAARSRAALGGREFERRCRAILTDTDPQSWAIAAARVADEAVADDAYARMVTGWGRKDRR